MLEEAKNAIKDCEKRLRELMAEASSKGQYTVVDQIMDWAKMVGSLTSDDASQRESVVVRATARKKKKTFSRGASLSSYPRFIKSRSDLVKIGWSKKEKKEYQHRASWSIVLLLCDHLNQFRGNEFTSEDVFPLIGEDEFEVPSYQSYLCLAWLRDIELITKEGRHGYFVPKGIDLIDAAKLKWKRLSGK